MWHRFALKFLVHVWLCDWLISSHGIAPRTTQKAQEMARKCCGGGRERAVNFQPSPVHLVTVSCRFRQGRAFGEKQRQQHTRPAGHAEAEWLQREMAVMWPEADQNKDQAVRASVDRWTQTKATESNGADGGAPLQEALWPASYRDLSFSSPLWFILKEHTLGMMRLNVTGCNWRFPVCSVFSLSHSELKERAGWPIWGTVLSLFEWQPCCEMSFCILWACFIVIG